MVAVVSHPDDEFHPPTTDDPEWSETCWFSFGVPERRLSGQLYPFFRPNLKVCAGAAYVWDGTGDQLWNVQYAKNFWHLPMPDQALSDISLANGIRYRCLEDQRVYDVRYEDPDGDELAIALTYTAVAPPNYLGQGHLDQPGRFTGTIALRGEEITVDCIGMRDRSWGVRSQFGAGHGHVGYSYGSADDRNGFHSIYMHDHDALIHGHLLRDGVWGKLVEGRRTVAERDPATGYQRRVVVQARDEHGRELGAEGRALNALGIQINPNLASMDCMMEWDIDGARGHGQDNDDWTQPTARAFFRRFLYGGGAGPSTAAGSEV
jgi:hypothetical protein